MKSLELLIKRIQYSNPLSPKSHFRNLIKSYNGNDWEKYKIINRTTYNREIVHHDDRFSLWVMTWDPTQKTTIHSHKELCFLRVLDGELCEYTDFDSTINIINNRYKKVKQGEVLFSNIGDTHFIKNNSINRASSLHLYIKK